MECLVCELKLGKGRRKFCSDDCRKQNRILQYKKTGNPNSYSRQVSKHRFRKFNLIELRNNKGCEECGYIKNISALDFHHLVPKEKDFTLDARNLANRGWEEILVEFSKCKILCANCHREEHNPDLNFKDRIKFDEIGEKIKKKSKCVECNVKIHNTASRCKKCFDMSRRKNDRPSNVILLEDIKELGYSGTGRKYGVSDNTIRKWVKNS